MDKQENNTIYNKNVNWFGKIYNLPSLDNEIFFYKLNHNLIEN